ncbi:hypothetical protein EI427_05500 [Flammeovirga pectinis]|uniref:Uncharacterized protein n=1 Tax=Flammeovirga pectinis TaxID=2494373 RepID=A0A3Q9FMK3_9BACT|nr:hypothetical protein [Flammeovirga pectinis]AZQ61706.1 hypothetical protein EI427_05500 [Flammeovirga pectinis]
MEKLKKIVTLFVLFVYTLAVAHTFIGHTHVNNIVANLTSSDSHCTKESKIVLSNGKEVNEHFEHKGHCDPNIYDFLSCLLGQIPHNETVEFQQERELSLLLMKTPKELKSLVVFIFVNYSIENLKEEVTPSTDFVQNLQSLIPLSSASRRGPPSLA